MQIPPSLLTSLENIKGFDKEAFVHIHESGEQVTSIRINPAKFSIADFESTISHTENQAVQKIPWSTNGYYLATRPSFTFDPLFHAGCYYVQEASSMFLEQVLSQTADLEKPLRILDLCASPGGKSTLIQSLISNESLLVSNDVIKSRAAILEENIIKWGAANTIVTNNDPAHFARLQNYFDVIVIDAPCSGSGLFRRDPEAIHEWNENNVQLCSQRQQRIIADVWPALKEDGILIYSTCSYSEEEDESIIEWMANSFHTKSLKLNIKPEWNVVETTSVNNTGYGYRFYPYKLKGEGFFISAVQKKGTPGYADINNKKTRVEKLTNTERGIVKPWLEEENDGLFFKQLDDIIFLPALFQQDLAILQSALYIKKAGIKIGKLAGKDLVPDHQLALSNIKNKNIVSVPLNKEQAIQYLRKDEVQVEASNRGWAIASYGSHHLGWMKLLPNRINNYYPKEWRILKH